MNTLCEVIVPSPVVHEYIASVVESASQHEVREALDIQINLWTEEFRNAYRRWLMIQEHSNSCAFPCLTFGCVMSTVDSSLHHEVRGTLGMQPLPRWTVYSNI